MINKLPLCRLKLVVEKFEHCYFVPTNQDLIKIPKVFKMMNVNFLNKTFGTCLKEAHFNLLELFNQQIYLFQLL